VNKSFNQLSIRAFTETDRQGLVALWEACELVVPWNNPNKDIDRKLQVNPELFLVAKHGNAVVGSIMGGYEGHRGWINYLAVMPEHRCSGLGRQLVETLEAMLLDRGCPKVNLQIRSTNTSVIEFYESLGYVNDKAVSMGKRLIPDGVRPSEQGKG